MLDIPVFIRHFVIEIESSSLLSSLVRHHYGALHQEVLVALLWNHYSRDFFGVLTFKCTHMRVLLRTLLRFYSGFSTVRSPYSSGLEPLVVRSLGFYPWLYAPGYVVENLF